MICEDWGWNVRSRQTLFLIFFWFGLYGGTVVVFAEVTFFSNMCDGATTRWRWHDKAIARWYDGYNAITMTRWRDSDDAMSYRVIISSYVVIFSKYINTCYFIYDTLVCLAGYFWMNCSSRCVNTLTIVKHFSIRVPVTSKIEPCTWMTRK